MTARTGGRLRVLSFAGFVAGSVAAFWMWFALAPHLIYETNRDRRSSDQQAAIDLARASRGDPWPMRTNAVSNNLFAWTAAATVWDENEHTFFLRGKWVNTTVCAVALAGACAAIYTAWGALPALVFLMLAGFGALLPRAVYFQPEPFYLILFTACAVCGFILLTRNPWWLYGVFGLCAGFAYLAKPGISPLLAAWFGAGLVRLAMHAWPSGWWPGPARTPHWHPLRYAIGCALAMAAGGAVVAPLGVWSAHHLGKPFFNMAPYWMWQDDYGKESVPLLVNHGSALRMRSLPPEDIPSAARWFSMHTSEEAFQRLADGVWGKLSRFIAPTETSRRDGAPHRRVLAHRGWLLAGVLCSAAVLGMVSFLRGPPFLRLKVPFWRPEAAQTLFAAGGAALYTLAYGWYEPIGRGDRFMMTLYIPLLLWGLHGLAQAGKRFGRSWVRVLILLTLGAVLGAATARMIPVIQRPVFDAENPL